MYLQTVRINDRWWIRRYRDLQLSKNICQKHFKSRKLASYKSKLLPANVSAKQLSKQWSLALKIQRRSEKCKKRGRLALEGLTGMATRLFLPCKEHSVHIGQFYSVRETLQPNLVHPIYTPYRKDYSRNQSRNDHVVHFPFDHSDAQRLNTHGANYDRVSYRR